MDNACTDKRRVNNSHLHKGLVFITGYLVMFLHVGLFYSIGAIFVDVMSTFNTSRAETAVIHSTAMAVGLGSGLISGIIIHRFGIVRCGIAGASLASFGIISCYLATSTLHMTIGFGILNALGFSCLYICSATAIGQHFNGRRKLLVMSLQATGAALGGMMYPYILKYLSDMYGFRGALLIIGGLCMNCIPGCLLWRHPVVKRKPRGSDMISDRLRQYQKNLSIKVTMDESDEIKIKKNKNVPEGKDNDIFYIHSFPVLYDGLKTRRISIEPGDFTDEPPIAEKVGPQSLLRSVRAIVSNTRFMIFVVGCVAANPSLGLIVIFVADVFIDKGLTLDDVTFGLLLMNIVNILGRVIPGAMMQSKKIPPFICPLFASFMATVILIGFSLSSSKSVTLVVCALAGIPIGMFITMFTVISTKLVGAENLPTAIGLLFSANGIGNAIAGPVSGYIRDTSGSYTLPFYSAACMTSFATVLFLITLATIKVKKHQRRRTSSVFYLTSI